MKTGVFLLVAFSVQPALSQVRSLIEDYAADRGSLLRYYNVAGTEERRNRLIRFYRDEKALLEKQNFDALDQDGKIDYLLFHNELNHELRRLDREAREERENSVYLPFASVITGLEESRRKMNPIDSAATARSMTELYRQIEATRKTIEQKIKDDKDPSRRVIGNRAANEAASLRTTLRDWFVFYDAYDPIFTWWVEESYKTVDASLQSYAAFLREKVAGLRPAAAPGAPASPRAEGGAFAASFANARAGSTDDIVGNPIGRDELMAELAYEMIPYTPEELIAAANREFAWCETEMKKASREMGFGDDWKKALEKIKTMYVEPGKQPQMIRDLAAEAVKFIDDHDLVTIPSIARETWRMQMMTPERQLVAPFFLGGEVISVSYPTNSMTFEQKMMSMRGNNIPMSRATVFHELIPGHHLQGFYATRYKTYRSAVGGTPFLVEGWSLYWELLMWDLKFQKTPEDRVGALFWRMHRCARIIFSLSFHLGKMSPEECINFLVDRVGHERENAAGEVRRSFGGAYGPLYQAAYLLGGMQLKSLHDQLVGSGPGKMTNRQFNDAVLKENRIPIEMIRASLTRQTLARAYVPSWRFLPD